MPTDWQEKYEKIAHHTNLYSHFRMANRVPSQVQSARRCGTRIVNALAAILDLAPDFK